MKKVYKENQDGTLLVSCTYTNEEYAPVAQKVQINLCKNVTIKGFRKGKAPVEQAIKYINPEEVYKGMINKLIDKDFNDLLDKYDTTKVANMSPNLDVKFDEKKKTYTLAYSFCLLPVAEIKASTGLNVEVKAKTVKASDVDAKIESLLVDNAELVPASDDQVAELKDHVIIDFTGYVDGKEFDGGAATDYELTLGSNTFVPGFEDQLVGMKNGEKKTIEVTFPANYLASLANKVAKFAVTVKTLKKVVKPELNDEFVTTLDSYKVKTVDELKKAVRKELKEANENKAKTEKLNKILDIIAKDSKVIVSDRYVENMAKQTEQNQINQFKQYGIDLNEYLKLANTTLEAFHANCKTQTVNQINTYAILEAVGTANKIEVSQKDIEEYFGGKEKYDSLMETAKTQEGKNPNFSIEGYIEQIKASLLEQKVKDFLIENN